MSQVLKTVILSVIAEALNFLTAFIFYQTLRIPLFFDTVFTVAAVFYLGLIPALCISVCYNVINSLLWINQSGSFDPFMLMYAVNGILIVISTWIIARKKENFRISVPITLLYLILITLFSSVCTVISGGIIDFFHYKYYEIPDMMNPIKRFTESFVHQRFSMIASCILAQIPISFMDRLIATFSGYGIYRLCNKYLERR